ncbi:hypothetical protein HDU76_001201 [Blyttiomyces sp. JEL0837]|nr:hypothetical protein HDU76_001201 [Blyttiomyces sp. JEL0837]
MPEILLTSETLPATSTNATIVIPQPAAAPPPALAGLPDSLGSKTESVHFLEPSSRQPSKENTGLTFDNGRSLQRQRAVSYHSGLFPPPSSLLMNNSSTPTPNALTATPSLGETLMLTDTEGNSDKVESIGQEYQEQQQQSSLTNQQIQIFNASTATTITSTPASTETVTPSNPEQLEPRPESIASNSTSSASITVATHGLRRSKTTSYYSNSGPYKALSENELFPTKTPLGVFPFADFHPVVALGVPPVTTIVPARRGLISDSEKENDQNQQQQQQQQQSQQSDKEIVERRPTLTRKREQKERKGDGGGSQDSIALGVPVSGEKGDLKRRHSHRSIDSETGLMLATPKDNAEFHKVFPMIPTSDHLIEDFACAFRREMPIRGRLWISKNHLCFASFFSTSFHIKFDEITDLQKKNQVLFFPNAVEIETVGDQRIFLSSFFDRDAVFDIIKKLWDNHVGPLAPTRKYPDISSSLSCTCNQQGTCEYCYLKTQISLLRRRDAFTVNTNDTSLTNNASTSPNGVDSNGKSFTDALSPLVSAATIKRRAKKEIERFEARAAATKIGTNTDLTVNSDPSTTITPLAPAAETGSPNIPADSQPQQLPRSMSIPLKSEDGSGPGTTNVKAHPARKTNAAIAAARQRDIAARATRPPVDCGCSSKHSANTMIFEKTYPFSLESLKDRLFSVGQRKIGDDDAKVPVGIDFYPRFLTERRKVRDLMMSKWAPPGEKDSLVPAASIDLDILNMGESMKGWHRREEYVMPMTHPLGPKQTRAIVLVEVLKSRKDHYLCMKSTTRNPDVFDGIFLSHLILCLTWCGPRSTRLIASVSVEFEKFTLLKVPIVSGAVDGLRTAFQAEDAALQESLIKDPEPEMETSTDLTLSELDADAADADDEDPILQQQHQHSRPPSRRSSSTSGPLGLQTPLSPGSSPSPSPNTSGGVASLLSRTRKSSGQLLPSRLGSSSDSMYGIGVKGSVIPPAYSTWVTIGWVSLGIAMVLLVLLNTLVLWSLVSAMEEVSGVTKVLVKEMELVRETQGALIQALAQAQGHVDHVEN